MFFSLSFLFLLLFVFVPSKFSKCSDLFFFHSIFCHVCSYFPRFLSSFCFYLLLLSTVNFLDVPTCFFNSAQLNKINWRKNWNCQCKPLVGRKNAARKQRNFFLILLKPIWSSHEFCWKTLRKSHEKSTKICRQATQAQQFRLTPRYWTSTGPSPRRSQVSIPRG